ncbi:hypothetical protein RHSIM_Rhsim01G0028400 [Rhododendron simsii]|uniref:SRP54-type proteins GTP-binding domain-containing protein n=1 Tax=Rhododendron simsii TaxID=118357 RepID=A0A834HCR3_RHOSS|nr:hypothetical protein RHSIM_Rhsim01G0028400 [Rhododendron simsii]
MADGQGGHQKSDELAPAADGTPLPVSGDHNATTTDTLMMNDPSFANASGSAHTEKEPKSTAEELAFGAAKRANENAQADRPKSFDWRRVWGDLNPVIKQEKEVFILGYATDTGRETLLKLAGQELIDNIYPDSMVNYPCNLSDPFEYIRLNGLSRETPDIFPYSGEKNPSREKTKLEESSAVKIIGTHKIDREDEEALEWGVRQSPVACGIKLTKDFFNLKKDILRLLYMDDLLAMVKREFSVIYDPKWTLYNDFDDVCQQLTKEAEARAEEMKSQSRLPSMNSVNGKENMKESMMDKDEIVSSDSETEGEEDAGKDSKMETKKKGCIAGKANLEKADHEPALKALKDRLMTKNVAKEIAEKLCKSVAASLEGKKLAPFTRISSTVREKRVLTLGMCMLRRRPYVVVFVRVNGVGKSTNLAKFRTHARRLQILIFEKGYEKDPAIVATEAIQEATRNGSDVVLVDTTDRMQKLADLSPSPNPRLIDGILVTKFDTVDDKVGAALWMVYVSGAPVMFVGCGQSYTDLFAYAAGEALRTTKPSVISSTLSQRRDT